MTATTTTTPVTYPVNLILRDRRVLVVGGGPVAESKVARLLPTGARVTVVAPQVVAAIADDPAVTWHARPYQRGEVASYRLAIAVTGVPDVDQQVFRDGEASGVWVNGAGTDGDGSLVVPAVARRGPVTVAVGTGGAGPAVASLLRRRFEAEIDDAVVELVELAAEVRTACKALGRSTGDPRVWAEVLEGGGPDGEPLDALIRSGRAEVARTALFGAFGLDDVGHPRPPSVGTPGAPS
jgi:siroheme synthase-like protein